MKFVHDADDLLAYLPTFCIDVNVGDNVDDSTVYIIEDSFDSLILKNNYVSGEIDS